MPRVSCGCAWLAVADGRDTQDLKRADEQVRISARLLPGNATLGGFCSPQSVSPRRRCYLRRAVILVYIDECDFVSGRKKQKAVQETAGLSRLPDLKDAEAVQKFFLEEIQLGEELLAQGDYEKGVDHLTNAIAVCGQPQQLLQVLQQTLPPPVFQMLLTKLPTISQRIVSAQSISDDDIE
ncbi:mitochondrial import receptor subunit TOM20 homolog B-like [Sinocyclocheilus grahami]|uniref:mitochondrial import receptor subunit TOM20 homolog B-like n=1 Tax=Sinocyclocheilus grahami TaxID=75366 RepID=UPI0007AC7C81|nr:PREDICTED: mitochondrial import receptor subunit TOM20 homolog B-like [Sinocyclocheilus grahami]